MRKTTSTTAAALLAAISFSAYGQQGQTQQQPGRPAGSGAAGAGDAAGELNRSYQKETAERQEQGSRPVQVQEKALWGLGDLPPKLMHKAMEKLSNEPDEARKAIMQAANILELQSAMQKDAPEAQRLAQAADRLRDVAQHVEYKLILAKDDLRPSFADAAVAAAAFYQSAAQRGAQMGNDEMTGYTLKGAAEYLSAAHAFAQQRPAPEVSKALFDASRLGEQIVKLSKPTTYDRGRQADEAVAGAAGRTNAPAGEEQARPAAARVGGEQQQAGGKPAEKEALPKETSQVVQDLGTAIQAIRGHFEQKALPAGHPPVPGGASATPQGASR